MADETMKMILSSYLVANPAADRDLLTNFCAYAEKWFADSNIIGVGVAQDGVSLRLGDGTETQLFVVTTTPFPQTPAVCVTGTDIVNLPPTE